MKGNIFFKFFLLLAICFSPILLQAQVHVDFTIENQVKTSVIKSQDQTGTCWCFATVSFIETEAIRQGKPEIDISEMYLVRNTYINKAKSFIRFQGKNNFSEGGQAHDAINSAIEAGFVPESVYSGLNYGEKVHKHGELETVLKGYLDGVVKNANQKLSTTWLNGVKSALDSYLGVPPVSFVYNGKNYTPQTFAKEVVGFNAGDYVEITSYSHHPYYSQFDLEIPDNWAHARYYNLPIDELIQIMDNALKTGYSVDWDGDVSEEGFSHKNCVAELDNSDLLQIKEMGYDKFRQFTFDNYQTTDDHLMHITGIAKKNDSQKKYYLTKNSWGKSNAADGFLYMSDDFVKIKTVAILVHKNAIPKDLAKKMNI